MFVCPNATAVVPFGQSPHKYKDISGHPELRAFLVDLRANLYRELDLNLSQSIREELRQPILAWNKLLPARTPHLQVL
jgi:hypothetical protein